MKIIAKNLLPVVHVNPIYRDLFLVALTGFLIAMAFGAMAIMLISK